MKPTRITIHCSGSPNGKRYSIDQIKRDHIARGFRDVGYHAVLQPDGEVQRGRGLNEQGAHVEGDNQGNIGICLIGTDQFTGAQWAALRYQLDGIRQIYGIRAFDIYAHHQFKSAISQGKTCPGVSINRLLVWYTLDDWEAIKPHLFAGAELS